VLGEKIKQGFDRSRDDVSAAEKNHCGRRRGQKIKQVFSYMPIPGRVAQAGHTGDGSRRSRGEARKAEEMKMYKVMIIAALAAVSTAATAQQYRLEVPVTIQSPGGHPEIMCATGVVAGLDPHGEVLAVRAGPGAHFDRIDRLAAGKSVYVCGRVGEFFGVVYRQSREDCGLERAWPRDMVYRGACRSGWAQRRWIAPVSG
jgi:hypothetical protein